MLMKKFEFTFELINDFVSVILTQNQEPQDKMNIDNQPVEKMIS